MIVAVAPFVLRSVYSLTSFPSGDFPNVVTSISIACFATFEPEIGHEDLHEPSTIIAPAKTTANAANRHVLVDIFNPPF